jgi:outer membrane immunogenic protein
MKNILLASVAVAALLSAPALAADMPAKAPAYKAPPVQVFNWTGFYAGIEAGGGWGHEAWIDNTPAGVTPHSFRLDGGVVGGQLGYRWQTGQLVFGIEGTGAWADLKGTSTVTPSTETLKVRALYSATGQVGYAWDRWLAYVKGGWAGSSTRFFLSNPGFTASNSQDPHGWTVGGGVDYALSPNMILGVEYDHFDLNYKPFVAPVSNGGTPLIVTNTSRLTIDQVVARLSYKF